MPCRIILFFFGILIFVSSFSQKKDPYECYSFPNVQANEVIKGIWKDSTGYIWLATDLGVLSYNGQETSTFSQGLKSLYTKKFIELNNNQLVVLSDLGLQSVNRENDSVRFSDVTYKGIDLSSSLFYPKSIFLDSKATLWIGETNAIVRIDQSGLSRFEYGSNQNYHRSFSFAEDAFGNIWAVSYSGLVLTWNEKEHNFDKIESKFSVDGFTGIAVVKGDHIILGGHNGLIELKVDSDKEIREVIYYPEVQNVSTLKQVNELLMIGTWDKGLFYFDYDAQNPEFVRFKNIEFYDVLDVFYDERSDELWVTGGENIALLKKTPISSFGETGKYRIESFTYDSSDNLYFTNGEEIYLQAKGTEEKKLIPVMEKDFYTSIHFHNHTLWIGDHLGRIFKYDVETNKSVKINDSGVDFNSISYISDIDNNLYVTSSLVGLISIDENGGLKQYENVLGNVIRQAPDKLIYVAGSGSNNILAVYNEEINDFRNVEIDFDYPVSENIRVEDIAFSEDQIFLASNEGVMIVDHHEGTYSSNSKINFTDQETAYSSRAVKYVDGALWVGTNNGIFYCSDSETVHFTTASGLPSRLIKQRGFSLEGEFLTIATAKGMAKINLSKVQPKETPRPAIENFIIGDSHIISKGDRMNIPHQSNIEISFRSFTYPGYEIQYRTRIIGISEEWNAASENQIISLFGIGRGEYTLEVIAKSVGQLWSQPTSINFRVLSPWYLKWWAYLLFCVFAILIVAISIRIYHYNLIKQKKKLQRLVAQGTAEIEKQKNEIIEQQNHIIKQKEELLDKNETVFKAKQALTDADLKYLQLKENQLKDQVEYSNKQITTHTLNIIQKNETLLHLKAKLETLLKFADKESTVEIRKTIKFIDESFKQDRDWEDFKLYFENIYTGFYAKLTAKCPELTSHDLRHCALIRLNLNIQECASILGISPESVKVSRARIRKKIQTDTGKGLTEFILSV